MRASIFTHYARMLQDGEIRLTAWADIVAALRADMAAFSVDIIAAYNAGFDFRVIAQTHADLGFSGAIIESPVQVLDIWQFACETKLQQKQYANIARSLGWVSPAGNIKTGADFAYRFVCGDHSFIEDHTALSDARIETAILAECYRQKKSVALRQDQRRTLAASESQGGHDANIHGSKVA